MAGFPASHVSSSRQGLDEFLAVAGGFQFAVRSPEKSRLQRGFAVHSLANLWNAPLYPERPLKPLDGFQTFSWTS